METVDRFRIIKQIAEGGQGRIYLCYDPKEERKVVLKILKRHEIGTRAFLREAHALMKLEHPNIVRLFGISGEPNKNSYLVMEYVDGMSLSSRLKLEGPLTVGETIKISLEVSRALSAAHRSGIVHKDVKPSNILLTKCGRAKLSDFGISSSIGERGFGERLGSVKYMAPELAVSSDDANARSDLYSLGVTMYEMLTGRPPFDGSDPSAISRMHLFSKPVPPRTIRKDIPCWLNALVMKLLNKTACDRFASAEELAGALQSQTAFPGSSKGPETNSTGERGSHGVLSVPAVAFLIALALFIGGLSATLAPLILADVWSLSDVLTDSQSGRNVPVTTGLTLQEAERLLRAAGIASAVRYGWNTAKPGTVYQLELLAAAEGPKVVLHVSKGLPMVPDLIGKSIEKAKSSLFEIDLKLGGVVVEASDEPAGRVTAQSISPGVPVGPGTYVNVWVSGGPKGLRGTTQKAPRSSK